MSTTRSLNSDLVSLMTSCGYPVDAKGVCHGYRAMWRQALLSGKKDGFMASVRQIAAITDPKRLLDDIESVKAKVRSNVAARKLGEMESPLSPVDQNILAIMALFDGVQLNQTPGLHKDLFEDSLTQRDDVQISYYTLPEALQKQGGIERIHNESGVYNLGELTDYLVKLEEILTKHIHAEEEIEISINNFCHAISISFDARTKKWRIVDANRLDLIDKALSTADCANEVMNAYPTVDMKALSSSIESIVKESMTDFVKKFLERSVEERLKELKDTMEKSKRQEMQPRPSTEEINKKRYVAINIKLHAATSPVRPELKRALSDFLGKHIVTRELGGRTGENGVTLAYIAARNDDHDTINKLANIKINVNKELNNDHTVEMPGAYDTQGRTPIQDAIGRHCTNAIRALINAGVNVNEAAFWALRYRDAKMLDYTISMGANLEDLMLDAAKHGEVDDIKWLHDKGVRLNPVNPDGESPLSKAVGKGHWPTVALILALAKNEDDFKFIDITELKFMNRDQLTRGFIDLINSGEQFIDLAQSVVDGKCALGKILNAQINPLSFFFSQPKYQGRSVTSNIMEILDAMKSVQNKLNADDQAKNTIGK